MHTPRCILWAASLAAGIGCALAGEKPPLFERVIVYTADGEIIRPHGLVAANLDADPDGYPDLAITSRGPEINPIGSIFVFRNRGADKTGWLGFDEPVRYWLDTQRETKPYQLVVADLNPAVDPHGLLDIAVSSSSYSEVFIFLNDPFAPGVFLAPNRFSLPDSFGPGGIVAGRFGGSDEWPDLAFGSQWEDRVAFMHNDGAGGFSLAADLKLGVVASPWVLVAGEFDSRGAGDDDVVSPDYVGIYPCDWGVNDTISLLRNEGGYQFTITQRSGGCSGNPDWDFRGIAKGAFDGGDEDDLAASEWCHAFVNVMHGDGEGGFAYDCETDRYQVHPNPEEYVAGVTTGNVGRGPTTDIVAVVMKIDEVSVLLGRGDGTFQGLSPESGYRYSVHDPDVPESIRPVQAIVVDLNLDGLGDIVTTNASIQNDAPGSVSVLISRKAIAIPPR